MNDLFELLFSNFLILAAIIGGIVSMFSGRMKNDESKQRSERKTIPTPPSYPRGSHPEAKPERTMKTGEERLKEYYEEKQKRLGELSGGHQESDPIKSFSYDDMPEEGSQPAEHKSDNNKGTVRQLTTNGPIIERVKKWDKKRLAEGVLMAEVLGPPRAHKPHRSHPRKR